MAPPLQFLNGWIAALHLRAFGAKAVTFAAIGVLNSLVDLGIFSIAYWYLELPIVLSNLAAWTVAVTGSYVLNSLTTFARESGRELHLEAYVSFATSQAAGLVANTAAVFVASRFVPVLAGKVLAVGASFLINFLLSHYVVFRDPDRSASTPKWKWRPAGLLFAYIAVLMVIALAADRVIRHDEGRGATDLSSRSRVTPSK